MASKLQGGTVWLPERHPKPPGPNHHVQLPKTDIKNGGMVQMMFLFISGRFSGSSRWFLKGPTEILQNQLTHILFQSIHPSLHALNQFGLLDLHPLSSLT